MTGLNCFSRIIFQNEQQMNWTILVLNLNMTYWLHDCTLMENQIACKTLSTTLTWEKPSAVSTEHPAKAQATATSTSTTFLSRLVRTGSHWHSRSMGAQAKISTKKRKRQLPPRSSREHANGFSAGEKVESRRFHATSRYTKKKNKNKNSRRNTVKNIVVIGWLFIEKYFEFLTKLCN